MKVFIKKHKNPIIIGIILAALLLTGLYCFGVMGSGIRNLFASELARVSKGLNQYEIQVEFDPDAKMLTCSQEVEYTNKSKDWLTHIYFHLHPNSYSYQNKPVFDRNEMHKAYPKGFSPGSLELENVLINGQQADYIVGGYSENILMLILEEDLAPQDKVEIEMDYRVELPYCLGRFGYGDNMYKAVNWYPIASVYDESGWNLDRYYSIGDPFYSDTANYRVQIKAPDDYIIAATGDIKKRKQKGNKLIWEFDAPAVRDFAWLAGNKFQTASEKVGRTTITSYYFTEKAGKQALEYAATSLAFFNEMFGEYPYPRFNIVESDFYIGGMEYPNLIMLDQDLYQRRDSDYLELITVHETAHQWWYGLVGNNQINDAWLDEGLTEYSTVLYYGHRYGPQKEEEMYNSLMGKGKYSNMQFLVYSDDIDETIHRPVYEFSDWMIYDLLVYGKGAMLFHSLRQEMGDELFFQGLRTYFQENCYKNADKMDMIRAFNQVTGQDWEQYFDQWLYDQ